jgi:rhodanese-related sulfurtransferase
MEPFFNVTKTEFISKSGKENTILLDVRNADEFQEGHLEGAHLVPFESPDFISMMSDYDSKANYLVYCRSGNRGAKACLMMRSMGFSGEIYHLDKGYEGLKS